MSATCEEDVMRIKKRLEKMMKASEIDAHVSIDMLNSLKKLPIDLQILKNTGIGVALNNLRKSCNSEELGTLAKSLLKNWKKLVSNEGQQQLNAAVSSPNSNSNDSSKPPMSPPLVTNGNGNGNGNGKESSLKRSLSGSPEFEKQHSLKNTTTSPTSNAKIPRLDHTPQKETNHTSTNHNNTNQSNNRSNSNGNGFKAERFNPLVRHISFTETKDPVRLKCREMLANALELTESIENGTALCDVNEIANRCEDVIYSEFKNTEMKYKNRIRSRVINLKDSKNPKFRESVRLGIITPDRLATMTSEEMASEDLKSLRAKFTQESIDDHQMARTQGAKTTLLTCSKCKKNNVSYSEMQTRSADEPMTTFAYCMECGHRWKFG